MIEANGASRGRQRLELISALLGFGAVMIGVFAYLVHNEIDTVETLIAANAKEEASRDSGWQLQDQRVQRLMDDILARVEMNATEMARQSSGISELQHGVEQNYGRFEELEDLHAHLHNLIATNMQTITHSLGRHEGRHESMETQ